MLNHTKILHIGGAIAVVLYWRDGEIPANLTFHRWSAEMQEWIPDDLSLAERSALEKIAMMWLRENRLYLRFT